MDAMEIERNKPHEIYVISGEILRVDIQPGSVVKSILLASAFIELRTETDIYKFLIPADGAILEFVPPLQRND